MTVASPVGRGPSSPESQSDLLGPTAKRPRLDTNVLDESYRSTSSGKKTDLYKPGAYLAPMVRIGTLPTRLLALEYGADLVWGPEIVDRAIIGATRVVDEVTGTVSYTKNSGASLVWQTHPIEKSRLIYQIGSANKELALQAAQTVAQDVSGIDLNCGCPKDFSLKGGMGAALLKEPDKLCGILSHLVANLPSHPISAKIRLLPDQADTLSLVRKIVATGISCLTVHCRTQPMRSTEPALLHRLKEIVECVKSLREPVCPLPIVANGDCFGVCDMEKIKEVTGVSRVMIARGAESNVSCFQEGGNLCSSTEIMPLYIKVGLITGQPYSNAKYCLGTMDVKSLKEKRKDEFDEKRSYKTMTRKQIKSGIQTCKDWSQLSKLFEIDIVETKKISLHDLLPYTASITT
ncbi:hypothetical protein BY996DRAFT_4581195 [Phakopsora pachyrhizi]|uniref:DUS-like FMN-binding domain-containing protein n=1 Tax=Phakopsora pachyrhizi TaxID=170000 RepID=A0AAV0AGK1_PHAPC|nr:hypothetical protein BY996DRAFT_4581195 [Phakopsora pachyrhizi]CAH7666669.1 hypothetical protein PPACK8108_LOCUS1018 [Phakopsora pachyrhizi]